MDQRAQAGDFKYRTADRAAGLKTIGYDFPTTMDDLALQADGKPIKILGSVNGTISITKEAAQAYGYWSITKSVMETVRSTLGSKKLIISGHSQGGGRAQLAGMYLQKKYPNDPQWPVITFGAVGPASFGRRFPDVDVSKRYSTFVDYSHVLDPWGNCLGPDNGRTCLLGTRNITSSDAYRYCAKAWGYSGPTLLYVNSDATAAVQSASEVELSNNFKRCRYQTHLIEQMVVMLQRPGALNDDGTTEGGCVVTPIDDSMWQTTGRIPLEFWFTIGGIILAAVFVATCPCCLMCLACYCCWRRRRRNAAKKASETVAKDSV